MNIQIKEYFVRSFIPKESFRDIKKKKDFLLIGIFFSVKNKRTKKIMDIKSIRKIKVKEFF